MIIEIIIRLILIIIAMEPCHFVEFILMMYFIIKHLIIIIIIKMKVLLFFSYIHKLR